MRSVTQLLKDQTATSAVEFGIVGPTFMVLIVGMLSLGAGLFVVGSLHYAVEEGARCASIKSSVCTDSASTIAYAQSHFYAPGSVSFSYNAASSCGHAVTGSITYSLNLALSHISVPLTAAACFP
jgi:Flp pilus assembly protein TadG